MPEDLPWVIFCIFMLGLFVGLAFWVFKAISEVTPPLKPQPYVCTCSAGADTAAKLPNRDKAKETGQNPATYI
jgi:hypothetical protein